MTRRIMIILAMAFLTIGIASAKTHTITLYSDSLVAGHDLKPGNYKVELEGEKVTITNGKQTVKPAVRIEETEEKYEKNSIRYVKVNGKMTVSEIRLGGTNTKLLFSPDASPASGQ